MIEACLNLRGPEVTKRRSRYHVHAPTSLMCPRMQGQSLSHPSSSSSTFCQKPRGLIRSREVPLAQSVGARRIEAAYQTMSTNTS